MSTEEKTARPKSKGASAAISADLKSYLDMLQERVAITDLEGNFIFRNKAFLKDLGKGHENVSPWEWNEHYQIRDAQTLQILSHDQLPILQVLSTKKESKREMSVTLNKKELYIRVEARPRLSENGKLIGCIATYTDITLEVAQKNQIQQNEIQLRTLLERINEGVLHVDLQGTVLYVNDKFCQMVAHKRSKLVGKNILETINLDGPALAKTKQRLLDAAQGKAERYELKIQTGKGETKIFEISGSPMRDSHGNINSIFSLHTDITLRRKANDNLRHSEARYRNLVEHMNEGLVLLDAQGNIGFANQRFCKLLGLDYTNVLGASYLHTVGLDKLPDKSGSFELQVRHQNGELFWHKISMAKYQASKEHPSGLMLMHSDITTEKKFAEERERLLITAESTSDYVAMVRFDTSLLYINQAGRKAVDIPLGQPVEQLVMSDYYTPASLTKLFEEAVPYAVKHGIWQGEMNIRGKNGKTIPVSQVIICKKNAQGKVEYFASIGRDISHLKAAEKELRLQQQHLQLRLQLKEMISGVATRFINLPYHQIDNAIHESLKALGELTYVDRVVINISNKNQLLPRYYWLLDPSEENKALMKMAHPLNLESWEAKQMKETGYLYLQNVSQIPEGSYLKEFVQKANIQSSMMLPLQSKGELIGIMSLTSTQKELEWSEDVIALLRITAQTISSALERKNTEALLNLTLQFENIITIISANFINILPKDINEEITASLRYVGEFLGVDQGYIFMANSTGRRFKLSHYWLESGMEPEAELVERVEEKKMVWIYRQIKKEGIMAISSIAHLPEDADDIKYVMTKGGIKSMIGIPIMSKGIFHGLLIFASFRRERFWQDETIPLLKIMSQIVANALERKMKEEELAETREMYRTLARNIPKAAVFLYDKDLRYRLVEGAELENQGYDKASMEGRVITQVLPPSSLKALEPLYRDALLGKEHIMEREFNKKQYLIHFLPVHNEQGEIYAGMVMSMDISDLKETQRKLEQHTAELIRSNEDLELFAYAASHDLQEPLRMVSSYIHLIQRRLQGQLEKDTTEFMDFAVDGVKRMQDLINDLLEYSRVDRKGNTFRTIDLNKIVEFVKINLQRIIMEKGATVTATNMPEIIADQPQMISLLQNLIENAIKFHGDKPPLVEIGYKEEKTSHLISVKDNGIGIDKRYFDRIFTIFQRLNSRSEYSGTGIGLAVCKKIVERHGGKLWVESELGKGTTFYFEIKKTPQ